MGVRFTPAPASHSVVAPALLRHRASGFDLAPVQALQQLCLPNPLSCLSLRVLLNKVTSKLGAESSLSVAAAAKKSHGPPPLLDSSPWTCLLPTKGLSSAPLRRLPEGELLLVGVFAVLNYSAPPPLPLPQPSFLFSFLFETISVFSLFENAIKCCKKKNPEGFLSIFLIFSHSRPARLKSRPYGPAEEYLG